MNFRSTGVWAHPLCLLGNNWKRLLRAKKTTPILQGRFRSKCSIVWMSLIQIIPVQQWIFFSILSTVNLNKSVLMMWSGCAIAVRFANHNLSKSMAISIQSHTCRESTCWHTRFGWHGSVWGDGFGIRICQEHWWQKKWVLARLSHQGQQLWYEKYWVRWLLWGCCYQFCEGIALKGWWMCPRTSIPGISVRNWSGIHGWHTIRFPAGS